MLADQDLLIHPQLAGAQGTEHHVGAYELGQTGRFDALVGMAFGQGLPAAEIHQYPTASIRWRRGRERWRGTARQGGRHRDPARAQGNQQGTTQAHPQFSAAVMKAAALAAERSVAAAISRWRAVPRGSRASPAARRAGSNPRRS